MAEPPPGTSLPPPLPPEPSAWLGWRRRGDIRASDSDREETVTVLTEHHLQGRLSSEELGERTQLAYHAKTRGDLAQLVRDLPAPNPSPLPVWGSMRGLRPGGPFPGVGYAGFWPRAGGLWIDVLAIGGVTAAMQPLTGSTIGAVGVGILPIVYFIALWATTGRTLGMWLTGVRVVRQEDGGRLGLGRSLARMAGYLLNVCTAFVGFAWAGVDRRKQGWHDKMAGSLVVRRLR
ncbi:MAG: RDD family protein [Candidatus Dormibacteria bacterium]